MAVFRAGEAPEKTTALTIVSSTAQEVAITRDGPVVITGKRINPTGWKQLMEALQAGNLDVVHSDAKAQVEAGAGILDVNAGVPGADDVTLMEQLIDAVRDVTDVPLSIDSPNPKVLSAALEQYEGKALVNSVNGEEESLASILHLVSEHNAVVIGLEMDDDGIPKTARKGQNRVAVTRAGRSALLARPR